MRLFRLGMAFRSTLVLILGALPSLSHSADISSIYFFGDSLTDEGRGGQTAPVMWPGVFRKDRLVSAGFNYAIGGSQTSNQPSAEFGDKSYLGQVHSFVSTASPIGPNPAAGIWTGTNNVVALTTQGTAPAAVASGAAADVKNGIETLAGAGVKTVLLLGVYDLSLTNAVQGQPNARNLRATIASAAQQYNANLASLSVPGTSIQFFNMANLINQLMTNPQQYGFQHILPLVPGQTCNAACQQTSIFTDTIHLTSKAQTIIGDYVASGHPIYNTANFTYGAIAANTTSAMGSAPLPQEFARSAAENLSESLFGRLDASRDPALIDPDAILAARVSRSINRPTPWTVFAFGDYSSASLAHSGPFGDYTSGLDYSVTAANLGVQYQILPELRVGAVFDYGHVKGDLTSTLGSRTIADAYGGAVYVSLSQPAFFADTILAASADSFQQTRSGTFGQVSSTPKGSSVTASERAGYLAKLGPARIGPVVGIGYTHTAVDAYTETGAALSVMTYGHQASDGVEGSAGLEARLAQPWLWPIDPYIAVTYEHEFLTNGQSIPIAFAYLPTQTLPTAVYAGQNAVKIAAGTTFGIGRGWQGLVTAYGLVGAKDLSSYGVNGGLAYLY